MIRIRRIAITPEATLGVLIAPEGIPLALTLEPAWRNNEHAVSCIPQGSYQCRRLVSPHFGETFGVTEVPDRDHILFHKGNTAQDTKGCIIVGAQFGRTTSGEPSLIMSASGYGAFMASLTGRQEFQLLIENL